MKIESAKESVDSSRMRVNDWGDEIGADESKRKILLSLEPLGEQEKFQLARWLLLGIAVLFVLGGIAYINYPVNGAVIFETCKAVLPPIVTLVIGYYFSQKEKA